MVSKCKFDVGKSLLNRRLQKQFQIREILKIFISTVLNCNKYFDATLKQLYRERSSIHFIAEFARFRDINGNKKGTPNDQHFVRMTLSGYCQHRFIANSIAICIPSYVIIIKVILNNQGCFFHLQVVDFLHRVNAYRPYVPSLYHDIAF